MLTLLLLNLFLVLNQFLLLILRLKDMDQKLLPLKHYRVSPPKKEPV